MFQSPFAWAVFAGVCFGVWPLFSKAAGLNPVVASTILSTGSLLAYTCTFRGNVTSIGQFFTWGALVMLISGMFNGAGNILFNKFVLSQAEMSVLVPVMLVVELAVATAGACLFFDEPMTRQKFIGLACAAITIALLTYR